MGALRGLTRLLGHHLQVDDPHCAASRAVDALLQTVLRLHDAEREEQRVSAIRADVVQAARPHGGRNAAAYMSLCAAGLARRRTQGTFISRPSCPAAVEVEPFVVPPLENNVYLVYDADAKEAVLVDTSLSAATVLPRILELGLKLKFILNTHGHHDHVADNAPIATEMGAKIGIHEADAHRLARVAKETRPYMPTPPPPSKADILLKENTVVKVGASELRVMHTPGHTEGSVCFHAPELGCVFTGDTLLSGTFGDANGPGGSPAMLWRSLRRLYDMPPETRAFPGHGLPTRIGDEAWIANLRYAAPH